MTAKTCPVHDEPMIEIPREGGAVYFCEWCHTGLDPKTFTATEGETDSWISE